MNQTTIFIISDTSTGESADMLKQNMTPEEQIQKAKEFFEQRAESRFFHPTSDSILRHMDVNTDNPYIEDELRDFIAALSFKRRVV